MTTPIHAGRGLPRRVAVTGASGFIGGALCARLARDGVAIRRFVRRPTAGPDDIVWDPKTSHLDPAVLDGVDAVVHLAGEKIDQRWTARVKRELRESRVRGTELLARAIAASAAPPRVFISGSAVGVYGDRGDELLRESSPIGDDLLAQLARDWEAAALPAEGAGVRVVHPRTGIVLSRRGGALKRMLLPFRLGLGGRIGSGRQWLSWISLTDMVEALVHVIRADSATGAMNFVGPSPVTNAEFTSTLGTVLHRPTIIPVPTFALTLLFGREMPAATLLASQRAVPERLLASGFAFTHPTLEQALRAELG